MITEQKNVKYLQWLAMLKANPCVAFTPSEEIDEMWHIHQMSPTYTLECEILLGIVPCHNVRESPNLDAWRNTQSVWYSLYGETLSGQPAICDNVDSCNLTMVVNSL